MGAGAGPGGQDQAAHQIDRVARPEIADAGAQDATGRSIGGADTGRRHRQHKGRADQLRIAACPGEPLIVGKVIAGYLPGLAVAQPGHRRPGGLRRGVVADADGLSAGVDVPKAGIAPGLAGKIIKLADIRRVIGAQQAADSHGAAAAAHRAKRIGELHGSRIHAGQAAEVQGAAAGGYRAAGIGMLDDSRVESRQSADIPGPVAAGHRAGSIDIGEIAAAAARQTAEVLGTAAGLHRVAGKAAVDGPRVIAGQTTDILGPVGDGYHALGIAVGNIAVVFADQSADTLRGTAARHRAVKVTIKNIAGVAPHQTADVAAAVAGGDRPGGADIDHGGGGEGRDLAGQQTDIGDPCPGRQAAADDGEVAYQAGIIADQTKIAVDGIIDGKTGNAVAQPLQGPGKNGGIGVVADGRKSDGQKGGGQKAEVDIRHQGVETRGSHGLELGGTADHAV